MPAAGQGPGFLKREVSGLVGLLFPAHMHKTRGWILEPLGTGEKVLLSELPTVNLSWHFLKYELYSGPEAIINEINVFY